MRDFDFILGVACGLLLYWLCEILAADLRVMVRREVARANLVMSPPVEHKEKAK